MAKDATINLRIPRSLRDEIDRQAERLKVRPSKIARVALERYISTIASMPTWEASQCDNAKSS